MAYTGAALKAAHEAYRDRADGASGNSTLKFYTSGNTLLGTITLARGGTVNATTGQLTFTQSAREDSAPAAGTIAKADHVASDGVVLDDDIPCEAGSAPVSGKVVLNSLSVVLGAPIELSSYTIG